MSLLYVPFFSLFAYGTFQVIDGSSSVSAANWELEKMCAKLIAMRLPFGDSVSPKTRVAFLQFTDEVTVGCPFTPQLEIFSQALPACVQRGGRTSARVALEVRRSFFLLLTPSRSLLCRCLCLTTVTRQSVSFCSLMAMSTMQEMCPRLRAE